MKADLKFEAEKEYECAGLKSGWMDGKEASSFNIVQEMKEMKAEAVFSSQNKHKRKDWLPR